MAKKLPVDELLRLACIHAETDRESFLTCIEHCAGDPENDKVIAETKAFLKQLREYRLKRWGKTELETICAAAKPVDVRKIACRENTMGSFGEKGD